MSSFLPHIPRETYNQKADSNDITELYELLAEPLHEELYKRQDFTFIDQLSLGQRLLVSYDYLRMQVLQGGFIQLIQNGYIGILPEMPAWLQHVGANDMAQVIDDVLKVYVLNRELLDKQTTVEEFAKLYEELKEFEIIDDRFNKAHYDTTEKIVSYAKAHIAEFAVIEG
jgi:hypothetical protein